MFLIIIIFKFLLVAVVAVIDGGHPKLATTPYVPVKYCKHPSGPRKIRFNTYTANVFPIESAGNPCVAKCSL